MPFLMPCWCLSKANAPLAGSTTSDYEASGELATALKKKLTDAGVCALARGCRQLAVLSLHGIKGIGPASLEALAAHCARALHP